MRPRHRVWLLIVNACAAAALPAHPWRRTRLQHTLATTAPQDDGGGHFFDQLVDHFAPGGARNTWRQQYFVNDTFWEAAGRNGPVFVCVGGEGPPLLSSVVVTGDQHCADAVATAARVGALLLALEHRFYGKSVPTSDLSTRSLSLLSAAQALADLANFHAFVTERHRLDRLRHKWITFGGSYPGMLAAWSRLLLPHLFHGAVARCVYTRVADTCLSA